MSIADASVGIPWYRKRDYERIRSIMTDHAQLPQTYENWRSRAETLENRLRQSVRTVIDPKTFARWCASNRLKANAYARLIYVETSLNQKIAAQ
jgi:hypothetical protein